LNEYARWILDEVKGIVKATKKLKCIVLERENGATVYVIWKRAVYDTYHFETVGLVTHASVGTPGLERKTEGRGKFFVWDMSDTYGANMEVERFFERIERHLNALADSIRQAEKANSDDGKEEVTEAEKAEAKESALSAAMNELRAKVVPAG
jgi:hypothetical protein